MITEDKKSEYSWPADELFKTPIPRAVKTNLQNPTPPGIGKVILCG